MHFLYIHATMRQNAYTQVVHHKMLLKDENMMEGVIDLLNLHKEMSSLRSLAADVWQIIIM